MGISTGGDPLHAENTELEADDGDEDEKIVESESMLA